MSAEMEILFLLFLFACVLCIVFDGKIINRNQKDLIQPRVNGKTCQSVAWNIVTKVLNDDNGLKVALGKVLGNESVEQLISSGEDND